MKKWIIIIAIATALIILGYLYHQGKLDLRWQTLTILAAVLAAPLKFITDLLTTHHDKVNEIRNQQDQQLTSRQADIEVQRKEQAHRAALLSKKLELLNAKLKILENQMPPK